MERKVRIKTNNYKDEWIYSDLTGVVKNMHDDRGRWRFFLDDSSVEVIRTYNSTHRDGFTVYPFISIENLIFLNSLRVE